MSWNQPPVPARQPQASMREVTATQSGTNFDAAVERIGQANDWTAAREEARTDDPNRVANRGLRGRAGLILATMAVGAASVGVGEYIAEQVDSAHQQHMEQVKPQAAAIEQIKAENAAQTAIANQAFHMPNASVEK